MAEEQEVGLSELLAEVRRIEVQARRLVSSVMAGGYSSVFRGAGIEFEGVREYEPGDDPRAVDWNVTARQGRPFVKKYVDERELCVLLLLDLSASMTGGFGPWSPRQMAARVGACLALSAVTNNDKVGLVAFHGEVAHHLPPKKGVGHVLRIVRDSLVLPSGGGPTRLEPAIAAATRILRRRSIVFILSDWLHGGWERALAGCARRHDVIAVRLLPPELEAPRAGLMRIRDPESGERRVVDWSSGRVRSAYAARVARWRELTVEGLKRAGADLMDVPMPARRDPQAVARPILEFFRMRERRGTRR